jgi:hypothetical protein
VVEALRYKPEGHGFVPTEAVGFFLLEKSTACSTIRYKRQLKVQYQDNEAQDTAKKKSRWLQWSFSLTKSFRSHYGSGVDSASNRIEYQEYFLRVKAADA